MVLPELPPVHQVILIDGNSVDGTVETARRVLPGIEIVRQTRTGKGNALACGFAAVTGDIVVTFDADGSADPSEIPVYTAALLAGADVAKGSRFLSGGGSDDLTRWRSAGNHGLNMIMNTLFHTRYTDLCYGYNAFWSSVIPTLELPDIAMPPRPDGHMYWGDGFEIETVFNCRIASRRLRVTEVPSIERRRLHGISNLNAVSDGLRVLRTIWIENRSRAALHALSAQTATSGSLHRLGVTKTEKA